MITLTDLQVTTLCDYLRDTAPNFYEVSQDYFKDLYYTGCRPEELLDKNLWTPGVIPFGIIFLNPLKGNSSRTFETALLSDSFINSFSGSQPPYNGLSLRQMNIALEKINPCGLWQMGEKGLRQYIFRYNWTKERVRAGIPTATIKSQMGWSSNDFVTLYNAAQIEVQTFPL